MNSLLIPEDYHRSFFKYIKDKVTSVTNFTIRKSEDSVVIVPYISEFKVPFKETFIDVSISKPFNKPIYNGNNVDYFIEIIVKSDSMETLKDFMNSFTNPNESYGEIIIYHSNHNGYWNKSANVYGQKLENIYLSENVKTEILNHIDSFLNNRDRYLKFGRSYKLCFLFTGVPGAGKSSLIKSLSMKYSRPIYILNLSKKLDDEHLNSLMSEIQKNSILVLEDIDSFFVDRESKDINVSFSAILNAFDGICSPSNGVIIIMTANNPERLDTALIRPGRVDRIIKFDYPRKKEIKSAFNSIIGEIGFEEWYKSIAGSKISMAGIVDYLFRHPDDYLEKVSEINDHTSLLHEITERNKEHIYK